MEDVREEVAAEVRAQLARKRVSGASAAAQLDVTQIYLWRRLSGRVAFDVNDLTALARLLDVPVTAFFPAPALRSPGT
jgi:transcriptional regulator with XRE-family HTH domain